MARSQGSNGSDSGTPPGGQDPPVLARSDIVTIVRELSETLAPDDVDRLLESEQQLRAQAREAAGAGLAAFGKQLDLSLDLLRDYVDGECSQIPYYTVSTVAAAILYSTSEIDLVPDFLPRVGQLDDAAVMAVAHELAAAGLERYRLWREATAAPAPPSKPSKRAASPDRKRRRSPQPRTRRR
jgi:uncharacterized membrane protein YkvA (DUF1232 family)